MSSAEGFWNATNVETVRLPPVRATVAQTAIGDGWAPLEDLRPVPCERRTVFSVAVSRCRRTEILAVDRLTDIGRGPSGRCGAGGELTLSEARKLAFVALSTGFRSTARRLAARLRALSL